MARPQITVDVVSDVVCPWCYLGKRRLEQAIAEVPEVDVVVTWRPYQLDPSVPRGGMDRKEYFRRKFGSEDAVAAAHARLTAMGKEEGIDYRFGDMTRAANTLDAHRLIRWAAQAGKQEEAVEALFRANFTEARDVGDRSVLEKIAEDIGLDSVAVARKLATDADLAQVRAEIAEAQRIGVTGVPCFIVDRRYAVMGAHPGAVIAGAIRKAADARAAAEPEAVDDEA